MAYTWEPRWEKIRIEANGIVIHTCRDKITGMIACPICIDAASKCLDLETKGKKYRTVNIFFFTIDDLVKHIREYHAKRYLRKIGREERESAG